uniref:AAA domain-containing protein n=1 Tax=Ascaris lumbricoides TaxID=6252 RepID=A0A0M3HWM9_ASCLU
MMPFTNKQSPFTITKTVHSGSSSGADSILDEIESIPEEIPLIENIDSCSGNSLSSMKSEITAAIPESGILKNEQGGSTSRSLKVTARKQKTGKQQTSQEETEKAASSVSESTSSTKRKLLSKESFKNHDYSTAESSDSTSASTSSFGSASAVDNLKSVHSNSDSEGSKSKTSVSASAFGSIRSRSLSKTSLETVNTEKTGTGREQFPTARPDQNRSVANRSENAMSQGWENTSYSMNNKDPPQVSRRKHEKERRKLYFKKKDVLEKGSHESERHDKGTQTKIANNRSTRSDAPGKTERSRSLKQNSDPIHSRRTTSNVATNDDVTNKSYTVRKKDTRSMSHENRPISEGSSIDAWGTKWDSKGDRETKTQLAISSERLRGLVRVVVDEILDGQNWRGRDQFTGKTDRSAQTDFYEEAIHMSLFDALPIEYIQGNARAPTESKCVPTDMLRLHIELLKREADRERRALREWDCIMQDFEQRSQVFGLDRLRRILNSKQLHNYL